MPMWKLKRIFYYAVGFITALMPAMVFAAFNDVTVDGTTITINLPSSGNNYILTRSTKVQDFTVNSGSVSFTMKSGSIAELQSDQRHGLSVTGGCEVISSVCDSVKSSVAVQCSDDATITITPDTSLACDQGGSSAASSGSGSSSSGGGGSSSDSTSTDEPTKADPARLVVDFTLNQPVAITVGGSSHSVTVQSASATEITVTIESEPITLTLANGETKDIDTDGDGVNDLRVKYIGLSGDRPQIDFVELVATGDSENVATDSSCSLSEQEAYKYAGSSAVYYVTTECTKRAFNNSRVFFTYFNAWSDVNVVPQSSLTEIANDDLGFMPWGPLYDPQYGALAKIVTDPKTYLLLGDEKYWINSEEVFLGLNYAWNWIEDIDPRLLNNYATGTVIDYTDHHPNYTLVKYADDAKVYRLESDPDDSSLQVRRHIADEDAFEALEYRWDRIVVIDSEEQYTDGAQLTADDV
jgi:hypothetical protein